jgi:glycosyltransferase involved in cell wall biosynthesis
MRAAIFNPYLDTLGGGERYTMAVVQTLLLKGYTVNLEWKDPTIKKKLEDRFGIKLADMQVVPDIKKGNGYDVCFWVSDGSIPTLSARKNILHFQVPFHGVNRKTLLNRMKLFRISKIVCNSYFTKKVIDKEYGVNSVVVYPPVDTDQFIPKKKENLILFVGRFSQLKQAKNQDVLIRAFKTLSKNLKTSWKLILAGGSEVGGKDFVERLQSMIGESKIEIIENPSFKEICNLYGKAKIFWSAVGYGVNEEKEPEKVEHFGITVVEAMAAEAIPVAFQAGGYREIIIDGENGLLWNKLPQLTGKSLKLISDKTSFRKLAESAKERAKTFGYEVFNREIEKNL